MIIFIDSNIVLDVMLPNPKMFVESNAVLEQSANGFDFYISASAITDIYYIGLRNSTIQLLSLSDLHRQQLYNNMNFQTCPFINFSEIYHTNCTR